MKENKFKQTEIGLIPEDWGVVKLKNVARYMKAGGTPRKSVKEYWNGNIPFVKIEDITASGKYLLETKERITKKGLNNSSAWLVPLNTILLSMYASIGEVVLTKFPVATNQAILAIIPNDKVTVDFFYYCLKLHGKRLYSYIVQTTQKNVNRAITENLPIPLPPLEEQQKIAKVLDKTQQAIELQERTIEQAKNLKKSLMQKLFTEGLYGEEQKETEIGLIPKSWEVVRLEDVFNIQQGKQLSRKKKIKDEEIECKFLRTSNVLWEGIKLQKLDTMFVSRRELEKLKVGRGDIFVCEGGDVGRTAILEENINFNLIYQNHLHRLRPNSRNIKPKFFVYWMEKSIRLDKAHIPANVTTIPNLSASRLKTFKIPLPPLEEQKQIAHILSVVDKKIEVEQKRKHVLKELFETMLHKLMSGEIRLKGVEI
ncbi:restriction endonuclease subunit S [Peptococcaceae bacterium]|nr:restriction endonuclease subunit S [Peptococcaceae bacterium]